MTYLFDVPYLAILLNKGGKTKIDILLSPMVKPPAFFYSIFEITRKKFVVYAKLYAFISNKGGPYWPNVLKRAGKFRLILWL